MTTTISKIRWIAIGSFALIIISACESANRAVPELTQFRTITQTSFPTFTQTPSLPTQTPFPTFTQTPLPSSMVLQIGNDLPRNLIRHTQPNEHMDNRIGSQWDSLGQYDFGTINTIQSEIFGMGLKRVRLSANGTSWDHIDWNESEFMIDPSVDDLFTTLADNGVTITYVLNFWDKTVDNSKNCPRVQTGEQVQRYLSDMSKLEEGKSRFQSDEEVQRYLEYVRFTVHHFKDRVKYFEIWNEPNIAVCLQRIEADRYINLVKRTVPVIREEYAEAIIKVGGVMPFTEPEGKDYFFRLLKSDIMPIVDAISWHVVGNASSPDNIELQRYYYDYPSLVQEIKDTAASHGFTGEYIADEVVWCTTAQCGPDLALPFTEAVAAKYYARSIIMNLGMDVTVGLATDSGGSVSFPTIQNLSTIMAGATPISLSIEIQSEANDSGSYQFMLPNGDQLVALWRDSVAVDDDPGIEAILVLRGFSSHKVIGINPLGGFEQQLITSTDGNDIIIHGLLMRDYPIVLRVTD